MTQAQQSEAQRLAAICETKGMFPVADELNRMHARILELELEQGKCLHQIAEPGYVVRTFRDYLSVHDGINMGGHAMDDMALDLARIALNFPEALKGVRSEKPEPAPPQAVQVAVPSDAEIDAAIKAFDWEGWTDPEKAKRAFTREALSRWTAAAHPAEGVPSHAVAGNDLIRAAKQALACMDGLQQHLGRAVCQIEADELRTALAATQPTEAARSVLAERARQIAAEGWTPEKDDAYNPGVLAEAGGIYALHAFDPRRVKETPEGWPWSPGWWKPKDPRTNLVKAGALVLAEIERIDRTYAAQAKQGGAA